MDMTYTFNRYEYTLNLFGGYDDVDDIDCPYGISIRKYDRKNKEVVEFNTYSADEFNSLFPEDITRLLPEKVILKALGKKIFKKKGRYIVLNI